MQFKYWSNKEIEDGLTGHSLGLRFLSKWPTSSQHSAVSGTRVERRVGVVQSVCEGEMPSPDGKVELQLEKRVGTVEREVLASWWLCGILWKKASCPGWLGPTGKSWALRWERLGFTKVCVSLNSTTTSTLSQGLKHCASAQ